MIAELPCYDKSYKTETSKKNYDKTWNESIYGGKKFLTMKIFLWHQLLVPMVAEKEWKMWHSIRDSMTKRRLKTFDFIFIPAI